MMTGPNFDELIEQMQLDEREDAPLITPVDYGKLRGIAPQLVYYRIRKWKRNPDAPGGLRTYLCPCGRSCIKKEEADKIFVPSPNGDTIGS